MSSRAALVLLGPLGPLGALATKKKATFLATAKPGVYKEILGATV